MNNRETKTLIIVHFGVVEINAEYRIAKHPKLRVSKSILAELEKQGLITPTPDAEFVFTLTREGQAVIGEIEAQGKLYLDV